MQTDFNFNIPLNQTHQFTSDLFCVQWRLRILLLLSNKTHELYLNKTNSNNEQHSKKSNETTTSKHENTSKHPSKNHSEDDSDSSPENPISNPQVEPLTLVFPLKIISDGMYVRDIYSNNKHELVC